jgi:hypothetical protein
MFRARNFLVLFPAAVLVLTGCNAMIHSVTAEKEVSETFRVKDTPRVIVETFNGPIDVICGVEEGMVRAKVTKRASAATQDEAQADLENIDVKLKQEGDAIIVLAQKADKVRGNLGASAVVEVPKGTLLDLRTSNGGVKVVGLTGDLIGKTSNGPIEVKGSKGPLKLVTSNGGITVVGGSGNMDLESSNGGINIQASQAVVNAKTSNAKVQFKGTLAAGEHSFNSSNGGIQLTLPEDAQFRLDASTSNGRIKSAFDVKGKDKANKHSLRGVVGDGQATAIKLHTSNGGIEILKGQ